jgi:SAM-dependent methyltransferase
MPSSTGTWDSVVASHVLEHSNEPESTVLNMKRLLRPGGRLILAVPNYAGRGYRELGMNWVWAQPPVIHVFHFTADGLTALLTRCGFKNVGVSFHERWDANTEADINHAERFRQMDGAWRIHQRSNSLRASLKRRLVVYRNSRARFMALKRSWHSLDTSNRELAELQVVATAV